MKRVLVPVARDALSIGPGCGWPGFTATIAVFALPPSTTGASHPVWLQGVRLYGGILPTEAQSVR